jgi:hypothetical protein
MIQPNGTDAKDIAIYFCDVTNQQKTSANIRKFISQSKILLTRGYTKENIFKTIDYITTKTNAKMYSVGYVIACIDDVLKEIEKAELKKSVQNDLAQINTGLQNEVIEDVKSAERNRNRTTKFGVQSRFREESFIDLFSKQ